MVHTLCCPVHIGNAVNMFNLNKKLFHRQMNLVENLVSHITSGDRSILHVNEHTSDLSSISTWTVL